MIKLEILVAIPKHNKNEVKYAIAGHTYDFCTNINGKKVYFFKHLREDDIVLVSLDEAMKAVDDGIKVEEEKKANKEYERFNWMKLGKEIFIEDLKHAKGYFTSKIGFVTDMRVLAVKKVDSLDKVLDLLDSKDYHYVTVKYEFEDLSSGDESERMIAAVNSDGKEEFGVDMSKIYSYTNAEYLFLTFNQVKDLYSKKVKYLKDLLDKVCECKKEVTLDFENEIESQVEAL